MKIKLEIEGEQVSCLKNLISNHVEKMDSSAKEAQEEIDSLQNGTDFDSLDDNIIEEISIRDYGIFRSHKSKYLMLAIIAQIEDQENTTKESIQKKKVIPHKKFAVYSMVFLSAILVPHAFYFGYNIIGVTLTAAFAFLLICATLIHDNMNHEEKAGYLKLWFIFWTISSWCFSPFIILHN